MTGFRLQPRTVWGTRRWFLGREMIHTTQSFEEFWQASGMSRTEMQRNVRLATQAGATDMAKDVYNRMRSVYEKEKVTTSRYSTAARISSGVYFANQIARSVWWAAQRSGFMDSLDPEVSDMVNVGLGTLTSVMGMVATGGAIVGAVGTGQLWMAGTAAFSLVIQTVTLADNLDATFKGWAKRDYLRRRYKKLGIPLEFLDF